MDCLICHKDFKRRSLPNHIHSAHKLKAKEYYDKYIEPNTDHFCPTCGKPNRFLNIYRGYTKHCSPKCSTLDSVVKEKLENTCLERYGVDHSFKIDYIQERSHSKESRQKASISTRKTSQEKYGVDWPSKDINIREKISKNSYMRDEIRKKNNTRVRKINTELECLNYLRSKFNIVEHNYKTELYPWNCDFYIKDIDTYVELNCFWTHGKHLFTGSDQDLIILNEWKEKAKTSDFFKRAVDIWSKTDVLKYETANKNKLNYLVFYTKEDLINYFERK